MKSYIAITCEALARTIYAVAATAPSTVSVRLLPQGLHNTPKKLHDKLQEAIDAVAADDCDAILLVYGLCGTSTEGLVAPDVPLVIPRAHDCITLYLGSPERYQEEFSKHPGTYWYTVDYLERLEEGSRTALGAAGLEEQDGLYDQYVEKYGKDGADALMEEYRRWTQNYTRAAFIDMGLGDAEQYERMAREKAEKEGWVFERKDGDRRMLTMLLSGEWDDEEFLVVPPRHTIKQTYGKDLIRAQA